MPAKSITDAFCRNVKLPRKTDKPNQIAYIDTLERGLALVLVVSYGGSKTWRVMTYDAKGRPRTRKLGRYPAIPVKDARAKAREYFENPRKAEEEAKVGSFKDIAEAWFKRYVEHHRLRSAPNLRHHLDKYIYPAWRDRDFLDIRRLEVNELLDQIVDDHGPAIADGVLATVRGICNWHTTRNDHYVSPIVRGMRRNKNGARERVLNADEIRAVWRAADDGGQLGAMVKLCLLTAQRRQKIATMRWDDVEDGVWTIAAQEREKGNAGALKLPRLALDVIEAQPRIAGNPFVFASGAKKHFNSWSQRKRELDAKMLDRLHEVAEARKDGALAGYVQLIRRLLKQAESKDDKVAEEARQQLRRKWWTIHDLRRTSRWLMTDADVQPDVAERVLGHAIAGVRGTYDRHEYFDQKADALARLAALVESIINPRKGNVVPIRRRQRAPRK